MASIHQDQRGFSAVESVLVIIIVAVIGFVGWYVYHTRQNTNKALDAATTTSNNAGPRFAQSAASSGGTDNQSLQTDLDSASSASNQGSKDLNSANTGLNDQSTLTSVPQ